MRLGLTGRGGVDGEGMGLLLVLLEAPIVSVCIKVC